MPPTPTTQAEATRTREKYGLLIIVGFSTFIISLLLLVIYALSLGVMPENSGLYIVNTFGILVGVAIVGLSFYLQFGPRIGLSFTPSKETPPHIPITLFFMGCATILTSLRFATRTVESSMIWRVVGYSLFLSLATGLAAAFSHFRTPEDDIE